MNTKSIIKALNLTDGEVLTLEKMQDRMEFEAFPGLPGPRQEANIDVCAIFAANDFCQLFLPCACDNPMGYTIDCNPYTYTN